MAKSNRTISHPASPSNQREAVIGQELGITNIMPASTWMDWSGGSGGSLPLGTLAVGRDPLAPSQDELVFMLRRDGQARAMLNLLTLPIRAAFASSQWVSPDSGGGEEETAFANLMWSLPSNVGGMEVPATLFLRQTLLALAHGFSAFEIVRQVPEEGPLAGMVTIKKMGYRDPRTVTFLTDQTGTYQGFRQVTNFGGRYINATILPENSWYYSANEEENPMYGVSMFEPAFQHYQMKRKMYYIGHLAAQLAAVPGRIGEIPLGASPRQIAEFKTALSNFAFNTAMVAPPNFKVTPFNGNSNFDFLAIIDHHNMMMAASILAKFLQQEDRQVLIDNGKADASADMFVQMLEAITSELSESWSTKLMPQFIDMNFGTGVYPVHKFAPLTDANKEAIQSLFETLAPQSVLNCTPEFVRATEIKLAERLGYDIDYDQVAKDEEAAAIEEQKMQQEQMALEAQQGQGGIGLDGQPSNPTQPTPPKSAASTPPASSGPIAASAAQTAAIDTIYAALSTLIESEDVPEDFKPEDEVLPETGE